MLETGNYGFPDKTVRVKAISASRRICTDCQRLKPLPLLFVESFRAVQSDFCGIGIAASPDAFETKNHRNVSPQNKRYAPKQGRSAAVVEHSHHLSTMSYRSLLRWSQDSNSQSLDNPRSSAGIAAHLLVSGAGLLWRDQRGAATGQFRTISTL